MLAEDSEGHSRERQARPERQAGSLEGKGRARRRAADREVGAATTVPRGTALEAVQRQSGLALREVGRRGACPLEAECSEVRFERVSHGTGAGVHASELAEVFSGSVFENTPDLSSPSPCLCPSVCT